MSRLLKIFIYGTLKRGQPNQHWLTNPSNGHAEFLYSASSILKMPLVIASRFNIPFLLPFPGRGHQIRGEIWEIDEKMLHKLDVLEDYPTLYGREVQDFKRDSDGKVIQCLVYFLTLHPERLLHLESLEEYLDSDERRYVTTEIDEFVDYSELFEDFNKKSS